LVVSCPSSTGESATKMAPRSRGSCSEAELPMQEYGPWGWTSVWLLTCGDRSLKSRGPAE
jgi:hypothetical protein